MNLPAPRRKIGWSLFIVRCKDNSLFTDICYSRELDKKVATINRGKGYFFSTHPERLPVTVVFLEEERPFKEAFVKMKYLRRMNKPMKEKLIKTKQWPSGKPLHAYGRTVEVPG